MRTKTTPIPTPTLGQVCRAFKNWRRTRSARSPIPAPLWTLAVAHARKAGVSATARQLRLNASALKQRVEAADRTAPPPAQATPAFVEVMAADFLPAGATTDCVIELADAQGATMRMTLKSPTPPDLAALSQSFWRGRA